MNKNRIINLIKKDFIILSANGLVVTLLMLLAFAILLPNIGLFAPLAGVLTFVALLFSGIGIKNEILLCTSLGVKKTEYIIARYLVFLILILLFTPLSLIFSLRLSNSFNILFSLIITFITIFIVLITIPCYLKFSSKIANSVLMTLAIILILLATISTLYIYYVTNGSLAGLNISAISLIAILSLIAICTLSIISSIKIYKKKEFR